MLDGLGGQERVGVGVFRLGQQGGQLVGQGSVFRAQVLALLAEGLLLGVGSVSLGLDFLHLGQYEGQLLLVLGVFLLLLAQAALHRLQVGLHVGDLLHHRRLMERGIHDSHAAKQQSRHHQGGEQSGNRLHHGGSDLLWRNQRTVFTHCSILCGKMQRRLPVMGRI